MSGIVEFLLARIGEDEAPARAAIQPDQMHPWGDESLPPVAPADWSGEVIGYLGGTWGDHCARWSPLRVLAECAAKRSLVEDLHVWLVSDFEPHPLCLACRTEFPCRTLQSLARIWSDHPAFDPAWAES